jgi:hypothetical protein
VPGLNDTNQEDLMSTGDKNGDENVVICEQSTSPGYMAMIVFIIQSWFIARILVRSERYVIIFLSLIISIPAHICEAAEATSAFSATLD